jgi:hypothetical protein
MDEKGGHGGAGEDHEQEEGLSDAGDHGVRFQS